LGQTPIAEFLDIPWLLPGELGPAASQGIGGLTDDREGSLSAVLQQAPDDLREGTNFVLGDMLIAQLQNCEDCERVLGLPRAMSQRLESFFFS
jgi:hypothetical protein